MNTNNLENLVKADLLHEEPPDAREFGGAKFLLEKVGEMEL
ncbi:MAG: hypothetical protein V7711_05700 [Pseudomonadales bacterium]